ncbi:hypothetical protein GE061_006237 [Apolygus lucorum]|uniref:FLYWCH-type domain-containing protein n=1 Tax=Apolygus lucorum TaxID=248454 RepID=A0A8S9WUQ2_APOLU|nr:hypothetical protein GE061_006237 [Apolygus lucorum]
MPGMEADADNNNRLAPKTYKTSGLSSTMVYTWHEHVYASPPKNPTAHYIRDILGWDDNDQPLNLTTRTFRPPAPDVKQGSQGSTIDCTVDLLSHSLSVGGSVLRVRPRKHSPLKIVAMHPVSFIVGQRGNELAVYKNFKFYKCSFVEYLNCNKWRCCRRCCGARIYIPESSSEVIKEEGGHNHALVSDTTLQKENFSNSLKRKATSSLSERPSKLIRSQMKDDRAKKTPTTIAQISHETMFKATIKESCELGLSFTPEADVCDFEEAIHAAVKAVFPQAKITGCRFHLAQSWWRAIQRYGLSAQYKEKNNEVGEWLKLVFGLPLLPPDQIEDSFVEDLMSVCPSYINPKVTDFCDYLTDNYIFSHAKFPPTMWAADELTSDRTTNCCQSFHAKFNNMFTSPHPNILLFIDVLLQMQTDTYVIMNSCGDPKTPRNSRQERRRHILRQTMVSIY